MYRITSVINGFLTNSGVVISPFKRKKGELRDGDAYFVIGEINEFPIIVKLIDDETGEKLMLKSEDELRKFARENSAEGLYFSDKIYACSVSDVAHKMNELLIYDGNLSLGDFKYPYDNSSFGNAYLMFVSRNYCALDLLINNIRDGFGLDKDGNFNKESSIVRLIDNKFYVLDGLNDRVYSYSIKDRSKFERLITKGVVLSHV